MRTVGVLLRKRREKLGISLPDVEKDLRIRQKYLQGLEEDNFAIFPSANYIKGFLRNYARFLGLDEEKLLAIFRRQFAVEEQQAIVPRRVLAPFNEFWLKLSPQLTAIVIAIMLVGVFFIYLAIQLWR